MINILGVNIDNFKKNQALTKIDSFFNSKNNHLIVTVNPEIILKAIKDEEYFTVINHSDMRTIDGIGVKIASWLVFRCPKRLTGYELSKYLIDKCAEENRGVAVINWNVGLSKNLELSNYFKKNYPNLCIKILDVPKSREPNKDLVMKLNDFKPELIMCSLGNPEQEIMLSKLKSEIDSSRVMVGIGGSLDYIIGKKKQAPKLFRILGLEWFWRLYGQPIKDLPTKRKERVYNAFFVFGYKFLRWRFILPFFYRKNVAVLMYKKTQKGYKVFMVERSDDFGHWQFPQGGLDGLNVKEAGLKEIREESGAKNIKYITHTEFIHKYKFSLNMNRHRGAVSHSFTGYKGQKQALLIVEYLGDNTDIRINAWDHSAWQWIYLNNVIDRAHKVRQESMKKFIKIFKEKYHEDKN
ncbi:MAG: WecB/TagA/CpsF family glycosyltransferase [Patescibacteria group bacterium]|nr:WecB/TagA/CpsF family glycosyltransferase [Patescibacteria group bacterium]